MCKTSQWGIKDGEFKERIIFGHFFCMPISKEILNNLILCWQVDRVILSYKSSQLINEFVKSIQSIRKNLSDRLAKVILPQL